VHPATISPATCRGIVLVARVFVFSQIVSELLSDFENRQSIAANSSANSDLEIKSEEFSRTK